MFSSTSLNSELRVFKSLTGDIPLEALTRKKLPQNDGGGVGVVKRHIGVPKEIDHPTDLSLPSTHSQGASARKTIRRFT